MSGTGSLDSSPVVVVPTYNELENLEPLLKAVLELPSRLRVLVVDDSSPDGTGELADRLAAAQPRIGVLHRTVRQGLGPAYLAGFRKAIQMRASRILQMDADFSHDPADLPRLIEATAGADLAIGSRYVQGGAVSNWSRSRRLLSRGANLYLRSTLSVPIRDLTAGFRCWRPEALKKIGLDRVRSLGYAFQVEMAARAHWAGLRIAEIPITFSERRTGASKLSGTIISEAIWTPWRLRKIR